MRSCYVGGATKLLAVKCATKQRVRALADSATEQRALALAFKAGFSYKLIEVESGLKGEPLRFPESLCSSAHGERRDKLC